VNHTIVIIIRTSSLGRQVVDERVIDYHLLAEAGVHTVLLSHVELFGFKVLYAVIETLSRGVEEVL